VAVYNAPMPTRLLIAGLLLLTAASCIRSIAVEQVLKITDVHTGWYDAGVVEGLKNKLVPSISFRLQNVSQESIASVQINAIFRRVGEQEAWGEHFVMGIGREGLAPGATTPPIVLRSNLGYTGAEPRLQMLQNKEFVDARVEIYGKHGSRTWVKLGEYRIDRQLLTH
jgi:hypothetical protein